MYSAFNNMWNWGYIQQQQQLQYQQEQAWRVADCINKLKDYLDSIDRIDPAYRDVAAGACCTMLMEYLRNHQ